EAVAELARIDDAHPLAPVARVLAGQIEVRRGRARAAEAAFLAALRLAPYTVQAHRELAYLYSVQHRAAELDAHLGALSDLNMLDYEYLIHWSKTRNVVWNPQRDCDALE